MGYLGNNLATVVCGVFAAVLTGLWFVLGSEFPVLDFVFLMAVPIMWFITFMCWVVQKGQEYSTKHSAGYGLKKNHNNPQTIVKQMYTAEGKTVSQNEISQARTNLGNELDQLRDSVKIKDSEIEHLKQEIANLQTRVEIEALKSELANLKALASQKSKRKSKKS